MKNVLLTCLSLALSYVAQAQADTWSVKFSNAIISRYQPTISAMQPTKGWEYSNGIILHGMEKVYLQTGTASYLNYIKAYIDTYVGANGTIPTSNLSTTVDKIQPGVLCLFLYEQTGDIRYQTAATQLRNYLLTSGGFSKTPDGGYWHKNDGNYNNVMMVDGMYMLHPFLTKYGVMFNDTTCTGVATFQLLLLASHVMYSPRTLPKHAWDYTKTKTWANTTTGESTDVWSRGTGWYMMALADVLQYLPTSHYRYARILDLFQRMSAGVAANQHPTTGLWYQVVDKRTETGNWTESSGSGMFVYALKKGVDNGWLDAATYTPIINKGWTGMQTQIATLGDGGPQIRQFCVASGVVNNTAAYYSLGKTNCPTAYPWSGTQHPHGYCGILMAASEMEFPIVSIPVTGVSLSLSSVNLAVGGTQQLTATVAPTNATNKTVTWSSSNTSVATVNTTGLVTAAGEGTAVITVTTQDGSYSATSQITVSVVAVTGVTVAPSSASIETGATSTLIATVLPTNATIKTVTWSSSNSSVATVNASGVVTGIAAGTAVITATTTDGGFTANSSITVNAVIPCTTIQYQAESGTFSSGTTIDTNYSGYTGSGFVNVPNATGSYLQVTVTALVAGTHDFAVRYANGTTTNRTSSVAVNGTNVISSLSMAGTGAWSTWATTSFSATLTSGTNTIRFTALTTSGLANIDRLDMCQKYISVTGVTIAPSTVTLSPGHTAAQCHRYSCQCLLSVCDLGFRKFHCGHSKLLRSGDGSFSGTAIITATTTNGITATSAITVDAVSVTGVSISPLSVTLEVGESVALTATIEPVNASNKNVSWNSSNAAVATVSSSGVVSALSEGVADITATTSDGGLTASCEVTVNNVPVTGVTVSPATATLSVGSSFTLSATVLPSNATNKAVTWSSDNTAVATVSGGGVITGIASGSAVITVTSTDGGFTAASNVTVSSSCTATGFITFERWNNISGTAVSALTSNVNYPNSPSSSTTRTLFEIPSNAANSYGCRVSGYICAPLTGSYTFWIAGDDNSELWLSTNNLAVNKVKIAYHTGYTSSRQWTKFTTQKSAAINLVQGVTYYVEALMKEGTGSDNLAVGWLKPGQNGTVPSEVIPGSVLSPRSPLKSASVQSIRNPENLNPGSLDVYPNPARGEVTLALSENLSGRKMLFAVLDMSGQVLMKKEKTVGLTETIDLHGLVSGLYMIRVNCEGFSANKIISVIQ